MASYANLAKKWGVFALVAVIFVLVRISIDNYSIADENTYYAMSQAVIDGELPYKDFFYAHPPGQLLVYAVPLLFGFSITAMKFTSILAVLLTAGIMHYSLLKRKGVVVASAASAIFTLSFGTILFSQFPNGLIMALPLMTASVALALEKRAGWAGSFLGLGVMTHYFMILPVPLLAGFFLLSGKTHVKRFLVGFGSITGAGFAAMLLISPDFIQQTILFHLKKPALDIGKWDIIRLVLIRNVLLFASFAAGLAVLFKQKSALLRSSVVLAFFALFAMMSVVFNYYFIPTIALMAWVGGEGLVVLLKKLRLKNIVVVALLVLLIGGSAGWSVQRVQDFDLQKFSAAEEVGKYIEENSDSEQTIFGDESITPLLSILSNRRIALNAIDNNNMRYNSGVTDVRETTRLLKESKLKYFVVYKLDVNTGTFTYGVAAIKEFKEFLEGCTKEKTFTEPFGNAEKQYVLYDCSNPAISSEHQA